MNQKTTNLKQYAAAFFFPMVILMAVFACMHFYPFGENSILVWDMNWQYVSYFSWLSRVLKETSLDSFFYSFSMSYGDSTAGLLGYYLLSPFNIILLFFQTADLPVGIFIVTILKLSSCGLTMYLYLSKWLSKEGKDLLLFSTCYALMAYNIAQMSNLMWIDAVILLPLVALGIYEWVNKKKILLFVLSLGAAAAINFYTGYMLCGFAAIDLMAEIILRQDKLHIKMILREYVKGLGCILLAVLLAGFSLIPVYYEISGSRMSASSFKETLTALFHLDSRIWELPGKLCLGTYNETELRSGLPNLYAGCLVSLLFLDYFAGLHAKTVKRAEKTVDAIVCGIFMLSMVSTGLNMVWHGFAEANGSPYRYTFLISFWMIRIAAKRYKELDAIFEQEGQAAEKKKRIAQKLIAGIFITAVVCIAFYQYQKDGSDYLTKKSVVLTCGILACWCILIRLKKYSPPKYSKAVVCFMFPMLALELGMNMKLDISHFSYANVKEYRAYVEDMTQLVQEISEQDEEVLYRIENDVRYDQICFNDAMLIGYPSITHYSSVMPYPVSSFAAKEGFSACPGSLSILYKCDEADSKTAGKSGIKYLIRKELPENMQGWVLKQDNPYYVLENSNYQPVIRFESEEVGSAEIQRVEKTAFTVVLKNEQKDSQKLLLMIPWHSGWQLQLDGESIAPDRYQDAMMEVSIPKGAHVLTMAFHPILLKEGIFVSFAAVLILVFALTPFPWYNKK